MERLPKEVMTSALILCRANPKLGLHFDDSGCVYFDGQDFVVRMENLLKDFVERAESPDGAIRLVRSSHRRAKREPSELWLGSVPPQVPSYAAWFTKPHSKTTDGRRSILLFSASDA